MIAHRVETTVSGDGSVTVKGVPFKQGEEVKVIILPRHPEAVSSDRGLLKGSVRRYERPFEPASEPNDRCAS
jgi:hypothetical protein